MFLSDGNVTIARIDTPSEVLCTLHRCVLQLAIDQSVSCFRQGIGRITIVDN